MNIIANTSSISGVVFDGLAGIATGYASYDAIQKISYRCFQNSTNCDPLQTSKTLAFFGSIACATGWAIGEEAGIVVTVACAAVGITIRECASIPEVRVEGPPLLETVQTSDSSSDS